MKDIQSYSQGGWMVDVLAFYMRLYRLYRSPVIAPRVMS